MPDLRREQTLFAALHAGAASPSPAGSSITMTPSSLGAQRAIDTGHTLSLCQVKAVAQLRLAATS